MNHAIRAIVCSFFLSLAAFNVQAADQQPAAAAAPAIAQPTLLQSAPGLSLLPAVREAAQPVATVKIGVVDVNKASADSIMGKAAQNQIKTQQAKLQKQVESKRKQLDKFKADTERQLPTLSPQQRESKSKEFQKKVEEFQKFGMNAEKELMASQQKLTKGLFEAIGQAAEELGKSKGLNAIVINRELLFLGAGVEPVDLTADLVKLLDEKGKKK
jgi:outer membrane protein